MYSAFLVSKSECMICNNQVLKALGTLHGVFGAEMDRIEGRIVVSHTDEVTRKEIGAILLALGFQEREVEKDEITVMDEKEEIKTNDPSL